MPESRHDILRWVNGLLDSQYTKIEQLGTAVAYCQIMNLIYGDVPMARVRFDANQEFQYVQNYKILQGTFSKHGIGRHIPVERLIKLRCQDNLEFSQWLKEFWDRTVGTEPAAATKQSPKQDLNQHVATLTTAIESVKKERDFYFDKLRELEVILQNKTDSCTKEQLVDMLQQALYNTGE